MKAIVEYDGTQYAGFQRQSHLPSIQGALETAIAAATQSESRVTGAGRTDAGAHARGQVVSFLTGTRLDDATLARALNAHLPDDIAIQSLESVNTHFDPRRQAAQREYHYLVLRRSVHSPLWRGRAHQVTSPVDVQRMRVAAASLLGVHDFAAFGSPSAPAGCTVREMYALDIDEEGDIVRFVFIASSFLQHMIRSIVGTLLEVGTGKWEPQRLCDILKSRDRKNAAPPVPAWGLYLMNVTYGHEAVEKECDG